MVVASSDLPLFNKQRAIRIAYETLLRGKKVDEYSGINVKGVESFFEAIDFIKPRNRSWTRLRVRLLGSIIQ